LKKKEIDLVSKRNILARNEFDAKVKLLNEDAQNTKLKEENGLMR
jgi:hypothetical protein